MLKTEDNGDTNLQSYYNACCVLTFVIFVCVIILINEVWVVILYLHPSSE